MVGKISILTASEISICFDYSLQPCKMAKLLNHPLYSWIPGGTTAKMMTEFPVRQQKCYVFSEASLVADDYPFKGRLTPI